MTGTAQPGSPGLEQIAAPSRAWRHAANAGPADRETFRRLIAEQSIFDAVERMPAPQAREPCDAPVRVAFWNAERCKFIPQSASLIAAQRADVTLLAEMDNGMARSANRHTTRALASAAGQGYLFAVEFIELDLGDAREKDWHKGEENECGLHGGGMLSPHRLDDPIAVRLELDGDWFDGRHGERRIGGRLAVAATLPTAWGPLVVASVHFESHGDPLQRRDQMDTLCRALNVYAGDAPVVIGGDFNTNTIDRVNEPTPDEKRAWLAADPDRLTDPVAYEPMFETAAAHGYDWRACNAAGPTQRTRPDGTPRPPFVKLDWFFTRGVVAERPAIVAAVDDAGRAISDHELIRVDILHPSSERP